MQKSVSSDLAEPIPIVINLVGILQNNGAQNFTSLQAEGAARVGNSSSSSRSVPPLSKYPQLGADSESESIYASTKGIGEQRVREIFPRAHILRPSVVFGPEDDFFNKFAAMARVSPALPLIGSGSTKFQPVYVGDVADAVAAVARNARPSQAALMNLAVRTCILFQRTVRNHACRDQPTTSFIVNTLSSCTHSGGDGGAYLLLCRWHSTWVL